MKRFTQLFQDVDATTSTNEKVRALQQYFHEAPAADAVWGLYLFLGKTRKRLITSRVLRDIFLQISDIPEWLFEDSYAHVGDSAETIALLLRDTPLPKTSPPAASPPTVSSPTASPLTTGTPDNRPGSQTPLHIWMSSVIPLVKTLDDPNDLRDLIVSWWANLEDYEIFVLNKVLTGAFRVGASTKLVVKALSAEYGIPDAVLTHRLMGDFVPTVEFYEQLIQPDGVETSPSRPYPFFLAAQIDEDRFAQEDMACWQAEWKWDGIRAQLIHRADQTFVWSRGEDLITHQFPELDEPLRSHPTGTVFDGEIVCWDGQKPRDFNYLQKRLGRKRVSKKLMADNPVHFLAYDLLEYQGQDLREQPLKTRQQKLIELLEANPSDTISHSSPLSFESFADLQTLRQQARDRGAEGLVIKAIDSPYLVGRKRGYWWKYKVEPMTLDAVLIYAQAGSGKRANLFTDYTFALWRDQ
ncbi:MAG: cisplatin damage response ATP-dependent DNA ligase, partial [Cyanobacteria bacterium P01_G01_bin.38]